MISQATAAGVRGARPGLRPQSAGGPSTPRPAASPLLLNLSHLSANNRLIIVSSDRTRTPLSAFVRPQSLTPVVNLSHAHASQTTNSGPVPIAHTTNSGPVPIVHTINSGHVPIAHISSSSLAHVSHAVTASSSSVHQPGSHWQDTPTATSTRSNNGLQHVNHCHDAPTASSQTSALTSVNSAAIVSPVFTQTSAPVPLGAEASLSKVPDNLLFESVSSGGVKLETPGGDVSVAHQQLAESDMVVDGLVRELSLQNSLFMPKLSLNSGAGDALSNDAAGDAASGCQLLDELLDFSCLDVDSLLNGGDAVGGVKLPHAEPDSARSEDTHVAHITAYAPQWAPTCGACQVIVTGPWYATNASYAILFGDVRVPAQRLQNGVLVCVAPGKCLRLEFYRTQ